MSEVSAAEVKPVPPQPAPDYDHTLYVIFHGAIAFYDDPGLPWIDAFLADLKDDHVYVCGKFLGELRIPSGSLMALSGVTPGTESFGNYQDEFVHYTGQSGIGGARVHLDTVYSRFTFPRPDRILHAFNFKRSDGKDALKLCITPVFQYRFNNVDDLRLRMFLNYGMSCAADSSSSQSAAQGSSDGPSRDDSFSWKPGKCDPTPLTLHVRAEEDRDESQVDRNHDAALDILEDYTNRTVQPYDTHVPSDELPGFIGNRSFWEVDLSLRKRTVWLTSLGAAIQRHPPAPSTPFTVVAPAPVKDDDPSCGGESGGPAV